MVLAEIKTCINQSPSPFVGAGQLRDSAESVCANIAEAYGRPGRGDRRKHLGYARGSAEETSELLRSAFDDRRLSEKAYWRVHHRLVTIIKMLTTQMDRL
jgi:four helix bundle protein